MTEKMIPEIGSVCVSVTGHDAGEMFILAGWKEKRVLLVDGRVRTLSKPKCKNYKHISILPEDDADFRQKMKYGQVTDCDIVHRLRLMKSVLFR